MTLDRIPIICDSELVDPQFGTGAVKVTPCHDKNDFECGLRHNLKFVNIFNLDGTLNQNVEEKFRNKHRFEVRNEVIEIMKHKGLFVSQKQHKMVLNICSRSGDVIEPMLTNQWYLSTKQLAQNASMLVKNKIIQIIPKHYEAEWHRWMGLFSKLKKKKK